LSNSPRRVVGGHPSDQGDRLGREGRAMRRGRSPGFPPPVPAKQLAVPAQERVGLDDQYGLTPSADTAGQEHQQCSVDGAEAGPLDAAAQDGELVPKEGVLGHERRLTPRQVDEGADSDGRGGRAGSGQQSVTDALDGGASERDQAMEQAGRHGQRLLHG